MEDGEGHRQEVGDIGRVIFLLLRDRTGIVQITAKKGTVDDSIMGMLSFPKESVISVKGILKANSESKRGFEIIPQEVTNLNPLSSAIPFEVTGKVPAELDVRLNNRHIDIRRLESTAIFNIQSTLLMSFRDLLMVKRSSPIDQSACGGAPCLNALV